MAEQPAVHSVEALYGRRDLSEAILTALRAAGKDLDAADKEQFYGEIHRVLRPGGRLALHEIMAGLGGPIHFPVPWARESAISFLHSPEEVRKLLVNTGFQQVAWIDVTDLSLAWLRERMTALQAGPPLGVHLLLGDDMPLMFRRVLQNLEEDRIRIESQ
jgi:hypothetical protein